MESFRIEWRKSTKKDLRKIPTEIVSRIVEAVHDLREEPRPQGAVKLSGSERTYRIRVGDYRIIYDIFEDIILIEIIKVRHRKDVYKS